MKVQINVLVYTLENSERSMNLFLRVMAMCNDLPVNGTKVLQLLQKCALT